MPGLFLFLLFHSIVLVPDLVPVFIPDISFVYIVKLFYPFSSQRFEIEIEPIFASLALYDVKEKKKVK